MRIVITNFGTTGDFRPLLALANELAAQGDTPLLAFPPFARQLASRTRLEYCSIGPDLSSLRDQINQSWSEQVDAYHSSELMLSLLLPLKEGFDSVLTDLRSCCRNADLLISGPAQPMGRIIHELTGIPFVSVQVAHFGGNGGPGLRQAGEELINPFRRKLGLPAISDPLTAGANSSQLALYAMSAHLRPRPLDWPSHYHLTGFFFDRPDSTWQPDPELENFFSKGSAPVVITLGSMVHRDSAKLAATLVEAVQLAGCRAVIQGMGDLLPDASPDFFWTDFGPHDWLFPRAACVVLHGGAGTCAATLRAGVPGVFIPHGDCYDQRYWAQLAEEAECSVPAIQYADLTPTLLASAITQSIHNSSLRTQAARLGARIQKERGVEQAGRLIHKFIARIGLYQETF
jgi:UDP:flavonoid glycosyltransferase YjiC (YdhE family)